jgi:hypothetical protein
MGVRRIPLKPNALNGGKAHVPKDHNGYIEPGSYELHKKTSVFADGAILFKKLHLTLPAQNPRRFPSAILKPKEECDSLCGKREDK